MSLPEERAREEGLLPPSKQQSRSIVGWATLIGFVILAALAVYLYRNRPIPETGLSENVALVCVETGRTYSLPRGQVIGYPAPNPDTGAATLLPYRLDDAGHMVIPDRFRPHVDDLGAKAGAVDPLTMIVTPAAPATNAAGGP